MNNPILITQKLRVSVAEKSIINGLDFEIYPGEVVALMGPNGSGKSSFALCLMGDSRYEIDANSKAEFLGKNMLAMDASERAKNGLFVAWQNPVTIPGVSLFNMCRASYDAIFTFQKKNKEYKSLVELKKKLETLSELVGLSKSIISRNVNEGFSGGEKKRLELMQLLLLKPKVAILDEIDSGLDVDGLKMVAKIIKQVQREGAAIILITHYKKLLEYVEVNTVCVMKEGKIDRVGGVEISEEIEEKGYGKLSAGI